MSEKIEMKTLTIDGVTFEVVDEVARSKGEGVFVGKYDTVTFTEIKTAQDAGKVCFLNFNGISLPLLGTNDTEAIFIREINENTDYMVTITADGGKSFKILDKNISDVYVAGLFSAKYAEAKAAYEAGKACFVTYGALLCPLTVLDDEKAEFVGMLTPHIGMKGILYADGTYNFTYVHSNAVQTVAQSLTDDQKIQARTNIGAVSKSEAVEAVKIGGTNLIRKSDVETSSTGYLIGIYSPVYPLVAGDEYTVSVCVTPAEDVTELRLYMSSGSICPCKLNVSGTGKQVLSKTFTAVYSDGKTPEDSAAHADIRFYRWPNVSGNTTAIHWVKIEKGNKATDWSPSPTDVQRTVVSMIPYGTAIARNSDLNTTDFLKVGNYYCSTNVATQTLANCPTVYGFMMQVYSPLSETIDNETTTPGVYRVRKLMDFHGNEYVQKVYSGSTANVWVYGTWDKVIKSPDLQEYLKSSAQTLTEEQKAQVRTNIGALSTDDVDTVLQQAKDSGLFDGEDGQDGKDGYTPVKGKDYFDGANGKTAYAYAQDGGYTGTEAEFAAKLASDSEPLVVTLSGNDTDGYTADKTVAEIYAARNAGRDVYMVGGVVTYQLSYLSSSFAAFSYTMASRNAIEIISVIMMSGVAPTRIHQTIDDSYVKYTAQSLDEEYKLQARSNIGAVGYTAPANVAGTEQVTAKFHTSNGGSIAFGKEGPNSGTMIRLDQTDGTCRLRFRASSTAGAMVWEQPEQGAQLYVDLGKEGVDKRRITFPSSAGTLALTSQIPSLSGYLPKSGGTMTGQLLTSFKNSVAMGSYQAGATTIPALVEEVRFSSGCMGSVSIGTAYTNGGVTIATGWYNFIYSPHRSGGLNGATNGDNVNYGTLLLYGMTVGNAHYRIRVQGGSIAEVARVIDTSYTGTLPNSITGTAARATADANGNNIASTYFPKSGGTIPGNIIIENSNPHLGLKDTTGNVAYFQTYDDGSGLKAGFGYGWANSLKLDASGNTTIPGKLSVSGGAYISGRYQGGGDDEGLIIGRASNSYAGLTLGGATGVHATLYLMPDNSTVWRYHNGSAAYDIKHPGKAGTIALLSDVVEAANGALKVTLSGNATDGYTVDKTLAQIETALNAGRHVYLVGGVNVYQLSYHMSGFVAAFTSVLIPSADAQVSIRTVMVYDGMSPSVFTKTL